MSAKSSSKPSTADVLTRSRSEDEAWYLASGNSASHT